MWKIIPLMECNPHLVQAYFQHLAIFNTLQKRFPEIKDVAFSQVCKVLLANKEQVYFVTKDDRIICEFTLENFQGMAAQVHFSWRPETTFSTIVDRSKWVVDQIFNVWKRDNGLPFLKTLIGVTPISNRAACLTVLRIGYVKLGVIPGAVYNASDDLYEDCMLSMVTK